MASLQRIVPCLWFASEAEEAARFYVDVFPSSRVLAVTRYPAAGQEVTGGEPGSVLTVDFELDGSRLTALNGGPIFEFNEAVSLQVMCSTQQEIDYYWDRLGAGGDPKAQQCGWLKDRYGLYWQIVPTGMEEMLADHTSDGARRAMAAVLSMKKLDIEAIRNAYHGVPAR